MKVLFAFFTWIASLAAPVSPVAHDATIGTPDEISLSGVHIINTNPRTVEALEDTHFRPK